MTKKDDAMDGRLEDEPQLSPSEPADNNKVEEISEEGKEPIAKEPEKTDEEPKDNKEDSSPKKSKEYYVLLGQKKALEKRVALLEAKEPPQAAEEVVVDPEIEKQVTSVIDKRERTQEQESLSAREREIFLSKYPEAAEHIDNIDKFRSTVDETRSLEAVWKTMAPMYGKTYSEEPPAEPADLTTGAKATKPGMPPQQGADDTEGFLNAAFG